MSTVRVNDKIKKEVTPILDDLGLSLSGAINIFLKQVIITESIPFKVEINKEEQNMRFGNLTISQLEERIGYTLEEQDRCWINEHIQQSAQNIQKDKLHIFDMPFSIIVGSEIQDELVKILVKYNNKKPFKEALQILGG